MMMAGAKVPDSYEANVSKIMQYIKTDADTALATILMTATLMDLNPDDPRVADIILDDCGIRT